MALGAQRFNSAIRYQLTFAADWLRSVARAKKAGATEQELAETTLVAAALRAGGAVTHGTHALE